MPSSSSAPSCVSSLQRRSQHVSKHPMLLAFSIFTAFSLFISINLFVSSVSIVCYCAVQRIELAISAAFWQVETKNCEAFLFVLCSNNHFKLLNTVDFLTEARVGALFYWKMSCVLREGILFAMKTLKSNCS